MLLNLPIDKAPSETTAIWDNHKNGRIGDYLRDQIRTGADLSFVSAYFTIYAYEALKTELDAIRRLRFLFGEPGFVKTLDPKKTDSKSFRIEDDQLALANRLHQKRIARDCAEWIREKVEIRSVKKTGFLHGKLYHVDNHGIHEAIVGSSNFTVRGLGLGASGNNIELNLEVNDKRDRNDLKTWFDQLWTDATRVADVKDEVLRYLSQLYANQSPQFVYYVTLFHLFRAFLEGDRDIDETLRRVALPDTQVWRKLFAFQRDGAKAAINKILAHNGCILADSVGLGKTYTGLAVIKYFELRNERVLVLCPKKLSRNWTIFRNPSSLNPFTEDKFRFDVLHHTDLSRTRGEVNGLHLDALNWGAYDLVVIDESHNFRNNKQAIARDGDDKRDKPRSRYQRLMEDVISAGAKTKVLLLSATPVNNQLADLRNQVSFIAGGDVSRNGKADGAFHETLGIGSVRETSRLAQVQFTQWTRTPPGQRKTRDLIQAIGSDFFKLLDGLSIARSRNQIAAYYAEEMKALGGFPRRPAPKAMHAPIDLEQRFLSFEQLDTEITALQLALYHPTKDLREDLPEAIRTAYQDKILGGFTQEGRERILIAMMKVNLLKRLESSVDSFRLTIQRTIDKINKLEERILAFQNIVEGASCPSSEVNVGQDAPPTFHLDYDDLTPAQLEDPDFEADEFTIGGRRRIHLGHIDLPEWLRKVREDRTALQYLLDKTKTVTPRRDGKLAQLKKIIEAKVRNPTRNHDGKINRKVLVFTAFADTARYLYENLAPWYQQLNVGGASSPLSNVGQDAPPTFFVPYNPDAETRRTRQHLPHWQQNQRTYFVTFRLADSLPRVKLNQWKQDLDDWRAAHPEPWDEKSRQEYETFEERKQKWLDAGYGSCVLADARVRSIMEASMRHFDGQRYILDAFVVMPNHVHALIKPIGNDSLGDILHSWKSFTASRINKVLKRTGRLWLDESFDHIVRSWDQLEHYRRYIRDNPVTPNLQSNQGIGLKVGGASCPSSQIVGGASSPSLFPKGQDAPSTFHVALVCGHGGNAASFGRTEFDDILTNFSPLSKERTKQHELFPDQQREIDLLIATDCISEGQNLQDCDLLINYDIHWNPVRIIQRFGRIDRIGSRNEAVQLVNFWPVADLDHYLGVKLRVEARMALVDLSATQTDNLLDPGQIEDLIQQDLLFRDRQLRRLKDEIFDLEDLDDAVSLTDFSLDEFRLDLLQYLKANQEELEAAGEGLYAVVPHREDLLVKARPGVVFCLRHNVGGASSPLSQTVEGASRPSRNVGQDAPPTLPYYLVYVHDDGTVRFSYSQPKETLLLLRDLAAGVPKAYDQLCERFDRQTGDGADMSHYDELLRKALASIEHTFRKRAASALLTRRGALLPTRDETSTAEGHDFDLVSWLVILDC